MIFDESVSRFHAEVFCGQEIFYLKDIGSTTGTFIKVEEPIKLAAGMILEIGSFQMLVREVQVFLGFGDCVDEAASFVELGVYDAPDEAGPRVFSLGHNSSIGRKNNNTLCFGEDLHMSNLHCKVNLVGRSFIFEDMASTNGSWMRLSREGVASPPFLLTDGTVFKIGNTAMYRVRVPPEPAPGRGELHTLISKEAGPGPEASRCVVCWDHERDCLIMPCKHNASCVKCTKSLKTCPICRNEVQDILKIYKP